MKKFTMTWAKALVILFALAITACSKDDSEPVKVSGVSLSKTTLTLNVGGTETLVAIVLPNNAENKSVTWTSSAQAIATVDANGKIIAVAIGSATITATAEDKSATCTITVAPVAVFGISLNKSTLSLTAGSSETLVATVLPDNVTDKTVTWTSSATSIATVDATGKVTAVIKGTTTITAACGDKKATCEVTVNPKAKLTYFLSDIYGIMGDYENPLKFIYNKQGDLEQAGNLKFKRNSDGQVINVNGNVFFRYDSVGRVYSLILSDAYEGYERFINLTWHDDKVVRIETWDCLNGQAPRLRKAITFFYHYTGNLQQYTEIVYKGMVNFSVDYMITTSIDYSYNTYDDSPNFCQTIPLEFYLVNCIFYGKESISLLGHLTPYYWSTNNLLEAYYTVTYSGNINHENYTDKIIINYQFGDPSGFPIRYKTNCDDFFTILGHQVKYIGILK